jgi:formamidopyrimidine-DNA glycosylase
MPEGAEVRTIVDQIKKIENSKIIKLDLIGGRFKTKPDISLSKFQEELNNCQYPIIKAINCKGKFIYWKLSDSTNLISTLGMSGAWQFNPSKHSGVGIHLSLPFEPGINIREIIYFNDTRHFGTIKRVTEKELQEKLNSIGPDMLNSPPSQEDFNKKIKQDKTLPEILMNQKNISGVGNYVKAEALFRAKLSPHRTGLSLSDNELELLKESIENVLKESYNLQGASLMTYKDANGAEGGFENFLKVYGKNQIDNMKILKEETLDKRTTWWCPEIQK